MKVIVRINHAEYQVIEQATEADLNRAVHGVKVVTGCSSVIGRVTVIEGDIKQTQVFAGGHALDIE